MSVKTRESAGPTCHTVWDDVPGASQTLQGSIETIESFGHNLGTLGSADCGGPMLLDRLKFSYLIGKGLKPYRWAGSDMVISGGPNTGISHPFSPPSTGDLNTKGATAIALTVPTAPSFNAASFIGEAMQDGMPSMVGVQSWRERTNIARKSGGEYLNVQYGWLPLVSDMRNFGRAVKRHSKILDDLKAGSGKLTRVGYQFPPSYTTGHAEGTCFVYPGGSPELGGVGPCYSNAYQQTSTWFKGAFTYVLPSSDTQLGKAKLFAREADKLFGIEPTPAAIWNAAPWTWALDWFTNAGDIMTNVSQLGQNGTVLVYGYMMSSTSTTTTINVPGNAAVSGMSKTLLQEFKKRVPANPYGFGVTNESLTHAQEAIIVALGLSHHGGHG